MPEVKKHQLQPGDILVTKSDWTVPEWFVSIGELLTPTGRATAL